MPIEVELLEKAPYAFEKCPRCGGRFPEFMRGQVQRSRRFLWILWKQKYCAVICHHCKRIIGWESPANVKEGEQQPTTGKVTPLKRCEACHEYQAGCEHPKLDRSGCDRFVEAF